MWRSGFGVLVTAEAVSGIGFPLADEFDLTESSVTEEQMEPAQAPEDQS